MAPVRRLAVEVRDPDDQPVRGGLVRFVAGDNVEVGRAETNGNGIALLRVRGAGRAVVTRVQPYYPARSDPIRPESERVVVRLVRGELAVAGRVVDFDGTELAGAMVAAKLVDTEGWIGDWRWVGRSVSAPQNRFRIEGLRPGRYELIVRAGQSTSARGLPPREPVIAQAGDRDVEIRLRKIAWVTFHWLDAVTNAPIETHRNVRWREDGLDRHARASGPHNEASTSRSWMGYDPVSLTATADGYRPQKMDVHLRDDDLNRTITFRLAPDPDSLVRVELVVRDSRADPVQKITIMRVKEDGSGIGTTHASEDGRVFLELPAGPNRLRFGPLICTYNWRNRPWVVRFLELKVERGSRPVVSVEIQRGGWLRRPQWEGKLVHTAKIRGTKEEFVFYGRGDHRACLAPGRYTVEAELADGRELTGEVEITADQTSHVTLELKND